MNQPRVNRLDYHVLHLLVRGDVQGGTQVIVPNHFALLSERSQRQQLQLQQRGGVQLRKLARVAWGCRFTMVSDDADVSDLP